MAADPILAKLIEKLNASGPSLLRNQYFIGDPVVIPNSLMPLCFISRDRTTIAIDTNVEDRHETSVVLNLVFAGSADLNQDPFTQAGALGLHDLCEGRDDNYILRSDTIAGVLRSNEVLDGPNKLYIDVGSDTQIDYVLSPPSRRGIFTIEAIIRTTLKNYQVRP